MSVHTNKIELLSLKMLCQKIPYVWPTDYKPNAWLGMVNMLAVTKVEGSVFDSR
jgi:hypothetical protein